MAERVIIPYVRKEGVRCLDRVMISHGDRDHSGGLSAVSHWLCSGDVWVGSGVLDYNGYVRACEAGQSWEWDEVRFEVLAGSGRWRQTNERSCVVKVTARGESLLLTGDIGRQSEAALVELPEALKSHFLLVPHHGSKHSSTASFLSAVQPAVSLVSSGYRNQFGHPSDDVVSRLSGHHSQILNTALQGSLELMLGRHKGVSTWQTLYARYWHRPVQGVP